MHVAVYLPLALPLLAAVSARWAGARLEPRTATWLLTGSALVLAAASGAALAILAATLLGQMPPLAIIGHWSAAVMRRHDPTSLALAVIACLLLAAALAAAFRAAARRVRALTDAASAARCLPRGGQLAVLDDAAPDAYAKAINPWAVCPRLRPGGAAPSAATGSWAGHIRDGARLLIADRLLRLLAVVQVLAALSAGRPARCRSSWPNTT